MSISTCVEPTENELWLERRERERERGQSWSQRMDCVTARLRGAECEIGTLKRQLSNCDRELAQSKRQTREHEMELASGKQTARDLGNALRTVEHLRRHVSHLPYRYHSQRREAERLRVAAGGFRNTILWMTSILYAGLLAAGAAMWLHK